LHQTLADIPPDAKVIIWVRYLYSLREIAASLDDACLLYGDLSEAEREAELKRFRCGSSRYLIATQGTGGHGLNLTEATYAVYYQNGFKYADRIQSEDRMHRIGQTVKPTYVDLVADGTIDNRIMKAIRDKGDTLASFRKEVHTVRDSKRRLHDLYSSL
jgi:SNF2 family DNA or RNA helicase